jgi:FG-GAP-like repeat
MKTKLLLFLTGIICGITNAQVDFQLHLITNQINLPSSVFPIDLDNDGDLDILSTSYSDSEVVWFENTDGLGTFGGAQLISNSMTTAIFAISADLDNDNDNDVVSGSFDKIAWYANNGNGTFGSHHNPLGGPVITTCHTSSAGGKALGYALLGGIIGSGPGAIIGSRRKKFEINGIETMYNSFLDTLKEYTLTTN